MTLTLDALERFEEFALRLAARAGAAILPYFRAEHGLEDKGPQKNGGFDPVTLGDKAGEAAIRQVISEAYPEHGVIGEEFGEDRADAEFVWVLDPIDGTRAFICGLPVWTTLIALRHHHTPVVGLIGQAYLDEAFVGSRRGSFLVRAGHRRPLKARVCAGLPQALIATTDPDLFGPAERRAWEDLRSRARLARYGCDAYAYAMVAAGSLDLVVEANLKAWDMEAAAPVLEGAGGLISDWSGGPIGSAGGRLLIAGDPRVHEAALSRLSAATDPGASL
jgi:histidinol phosphatase-like enzyme (inositol monophosphatase family)